MRASLGTAAALLCAVAVAASARSVRMPITPHADDGAAAAPAAGHTAARRVAQGASFDNATGIFRLDGAASTYAFRLRGAVSSLRPRPPRRRPHPLSPPAQTASSSTCTGAASWAPTMWRS